MVGKTQDLLKDYITYDGPDFFICKLCKPPQRLSRKDGASTNAVNHLPVKHPDEHAKFQEKKRKADLPPAGVPSLKKFFSSSAPTRTTETAASSLEVALRSVSSQQRQATIEEITDKSFVNGRGKAKVDRALLKLITTLPLWSSSAPFGLRTKCPAVEQLIAISEVLPIITAHEWMLMQNVVELLRPIYDATVALQSRQTCASAILPLYFSLQQKPLPGQELAKMHRAIITGLDTRMNEWINDHLLVLATVLDPRFKLSRFQRSHHPKVLQMLENKAIAKSIELSGENSPTASSDNGAEEDDLLMKILGSVEGSSSTPADPNPNATAKAKVEVAEYLKERTTKQNAFAYWKNPENAARFPILRNIAYAYLSAPATSTESERMFSGADLIYSVRRQSMSDKTLQKLLFLHMNVDLI